MNFMSYAVQILMYLRMAGMVTFGIAMDFHTLMSIFWQDQRVHNLITQLPIFFFLECSNVEEDRDSLFPCHTELESPTDSGMISHLHYF